MHKKIFEYENFLKKTLSINDFTLTEIKELVNGMQYHFSKGNDKLTLNVYYSANKGISVVVNGKSSSLKDEVRELLDGNEKNETIQGKIVQPVLRSEESKKISDDSQKSEKLHDWKCWIGTDESGKGDYFGPLVCCGFYADESIVNRLKELGVQDSKRLGENDITRICHALLKEYKERYELIILMPEKYNELYKKFVLNGKKLNELLAWMHSRIILNLTEKHKPEGIIVDKFASLAVIKNSLTEMKTQKILAVEKGERDLAVAAASIIARYYFVERMKTLSRFYKTPLPLGAGNNVTQAAKKFVAENGKDKLEQIAKLHFVTTQKVTGK